MTEAKPTAELIVKDERPLAPWDKAREFLALARTYWLGTTAPDGRAQVRPLCGVVVDGAVQLASNPGSRKSGNLRHDRRCTVTASCVELDMVLEGTAVVIRDASATRRAADAFMAKYEWPLIPGDDGFDAPYGAPTSGGPPYELWELTPELAFGFPTAGMYAPTRWRFPAG